MNRILYIILIFYALTNIPEIYADTIDVWTIKVNDRVVLRSNENLIVNQNEPMKVNIDSLSETDTLKIYYWTDDGIEKEKWQFIFKDSYDSVFDKISNPIDSSIHCFPTPCKVFSIRKNYVAFRINDLKTQMKKNNTATIQVEFYHDNSKRGQQYRNKKVAIILNKPGVNSK